MLLTRLVSWPFVVDLVFLAFIVDSLCLAFTSVLMVTKVLAKLIITMATCIVRVAPLVALRVTDVILVVAPWRSCMTMMVRTVPIMVVVAAVS